MLCKYRSYYKGVRCIGVGNVMASGEFDNAFVEASYRAMRKLDDAARVAIGRGHSR